MRWQNAWQHLSFFSIFRTFVAKKKKKTTFFLSILPFLSPNCLSSFDNQFSENAKFNNRLSLVPPTAFSRNSPPRNLEEGRRNKVMELLKPSSSFFFAIQFARLSKKEGRRRFLLISLMPETERERKKEGDDGIFNAIPTVEKKRPFYLPAEEKGRKRNCFSNLPFFFYIYFSLVVCENGVRLFSPPPVSKNRREAFSLMLPPPPWRYGFSYHYLVYCWDYRRGGRTVWWVA